MYEVYKYDSATMSYTPEGRVKWAQNSYNLHKHRKFIL